MRLKQSSLLNFQVVMALYCQGFSEKQICDGLNIRASKLNTARISGIAYLEGLLIGCGFVFIDKTQLHQHNVGHHRLR